MKLAAALMKTCESASYGGKESALGIGDDLEVGDIEFHRFATSIKALDLTNAGKRGKSAKEISLYSLGSNNQQPIVELIPKLLKVEDIEEVEVLFRQVADHNQEWKVQVQDKKGVDTFRKLGNTVEINNGKLRLSASPKNVSFEDLTDKANNESGYVNDDKKTELKKAWDVISKNKDKIEKMNYLEFRKLLGNNNVNYRTYLGMD